MTDSLTLSAVLCSRLCHDLVNPVGAVTNGIEILADEHDPEMQEQVLALLEQSARQVSNRLQFFRLAFGAATGVGESVAVGQIRAAAEALFAEGKTVLDWQVTLGEMSKDASRVLLNLVLVAGESLIRGGGVTVAAAHRGGGVTVTVTAQGDRILLSDGVRLALSGEADVATLDPKGAPAYLALEFAGKTGGRITLDEGDGGYLTLTAVLS